ncbi:MAG TPA: outer membrane beta-barrel protein [Chitinophagaceae bacterium]|nr:outer membrane beta-barrel protein [Chitinophagaceae bacterium]
MRKCLTTLFFFLSYIVIHAQEATVKGTITDTAEHKNMANAVVVLSRKSDSTMFAYTRTDKNGRFQLFKIPIGQYQILITFPKFADFSDEITLKDSLLDLGNIAITNRGLLMREVVVRTSAAIRIKGDTTEFTADSFMVKDGATVEDLLKKFPGFSVNSKGEITAQGKKVDKVLVDGEEFFGDDPTMATQNLGAKAVDKVQMYDTKSEQQNLTGATTGSEGKTINIRLKEDSKKGAFGKISAGSDLQKYHDSRALYNRFKGKQKLSLYATRSNTSTGSLDWNDRQKLGLENDFEYDELGDYYYSFNEGDEFDNWSVRGLPNSYTAGALYINKWAEDKQGINISYRYNRLRTDNEATTNMQNILPTTINYRNKFTTSQGLNFQHAINGKWEWKLDSLATLKFTTAGSYKETDLDADVTSQFLNNNKVLINNSDQERNGHTERTKWDNSLVYKQLFKKKDRQLMATLRYGLTEDLQNNLNRTTTDFYRNNAIDSTDIIDQLRKFDGDSRSMGGKVTYTEPLSKKIWLVLDYAHNRNNATSLRNTFSKSYDGKYESAVPSYSNNFDLDAVSNSGMALFRLIKPKVKAMAGTGLSSVRLNLHNLDNNSRNKYDFLNYTPQANFNYSPKAQTSINIGYRGTTRQPTIDQLQPIRINDDPLYEFQGNPDLKVGFNHSINLNIHQFKLLKQRYLYLGSSLNLLNNAITNLTTIDTFLGKQIYKPVNVDGNVNWNLYGGWFKQGGPKKWNFGVNMNGNGGVNYSFVQQQSGIVKNKTTYTTFGGGPEARYDEEEKKSISIRPQISYNTSQSSIQPDVENNYFTYGGNLEGFYMLPLKLEVSTDINFDFRQKLAAFPTAQNFTIWNANLARKFFKKKTGKLIFEAHDLLNQNRGFNRFVQTNFIQEERYNRISRYFLLRFEWTFNKMPGQQATK